MPYWKVKPPTPSVSLTGNLPAFKPQLGGKIKIPTEVTFSFNASLQGGEASVGYSGGFTIPVAGDDLQMSLNTNMTFDIKNPEPEIEVSMVMAGGTPWKKAFGIKWLTIEDYTMSFNVKPSELGVGFSGFTSFGSKRFGVGGDAAWGAKTAGFPIPSDLSLSVDDGPDKIGSISLKDIIVVANEIIGAATGKKPLKPDLAPDVRLQGAKKGEGPYIEIGNITEPLNAAISLGGELVVLARNWRALITPSSAQARVSTSKPRRQT